MPETEGVVWEEYHDRSTGLMIFGLLQLGMAILAILAAMMMGLSWMMSAQTMPGFDKMGVMMAGSAFMAVTAAVVFVTLGVGSMLARRWARTLSLTVWYFALGYGIYTVIMWVVMAPVMSAAMEASMKSAAAPMPPGSAPPPGMASFMMVFMMVMAAVMGIGIPLPFVLFYRSRHVKATCEWRDPVPRWTDTRPVPVLVGSLLMILIASTNLLLASNNSLYVGVSLKGVAAIAGGIAIVAVCVAAIVGFLRMRIWGWWIAFILSVFEVGVWIQAAATGRTDIVDYMTYMPGNVPGSLGAPQFLLSMLWTAAAMYVIIFLYVLWVRRYFNRAPKVATA